MRAKAEGIGSTGVKEDNWYLWDPLYCGINRGPQLLSRGCLALNNRSRAKPGFETGSGARAFKQVK